MTRSYDLVVIGAGPAGESAVELASFLGHSVQAFVRYLKMTYVAHIDDIDLI
jgi:pyruvate/2-oxoglutarate dehydrogenase complex dihydrolipoamide dehydrogenase (E3) component